MDFDLITYLFSLLTQFIPHGWAVALVASFVVASVITNLFATPGRPVAGGRWTAWLWWLIYRLCELIAMVGARAKQRPDVAAQVLGVADAMTRRASGKIADSDLRRLADAAEKLRK